ncbi:GTPase HflX [Candidatus Peregrinibacteria bacterium]|nr:MAG: GTPase HflX [Candidatus Peregrinibacteria bacterium]
MRVILVDIIDPKLHIKEAHKRLVELEKLVNTYGSCVIVKCIQKKQVPNYKTFIGKGRLEEIMQTAIAEKVDTIILNNILKSGQVFSLQWKFQEHDIQVWDRTDLILKIFEKHATTSEAKLQIELAAIRHMGPRIYGMGMELSKQGGGGVGMRGKGETNTEIMKRHLSKQEQSVKKKLAEVMKRQELQMNARKRKGFFSVAIVGYTNAGKSHLLHSLTRKNIYVENELFATLDTRIGKLYLPGRRSTCLISDTIGFIQDLPPKLIQAFASTLNEAVHADVLLHVIDYSDKDKDMKIQVVLDILEQLGATNMPQVFVCNKIDKIEKLYTKTFAKKFKKYSPVFISALNKDGFDTLLSKIESILPENWYD